MVKHSGTDRKRTALDELMDNAAGLPAGSQDLLLMMAKAMRYTRDCLTQQNAPEPPSKPPEDHPA